MYYSYPKLKKLEKIGASLCPKCPAMTANARPEKTIALSAADLAALFTEGKLASDTAYAVNDAATLVLENAAFDGNGATVIAPAGVILRAIASCKNLTVLEGGVTLCDSKGAVLENVQISCDSVALTLEDTACETDIVDTRLSAKNTALVNKSASLNLSASYLEAPIALSDTACGDGLYVNNVMVGNVTLATVDTTLRDATVTGNITCAPKSVNMLIAASKISGSVTLNGTHNAVLLLSDVHPTVVLVVLVATTPQAECTLEELVGITVSIVAQCKMYTVVCTDIGCETHGLTEVEVVAIGIACPYAHPPCITYHIDGTIKIVTINKLAILVLA